MINYKENSDDPIIEIFSGSLWEAELLKSLLEDSGIKTFLKNNVLNTYLFDPGFAEGVKIMILKSDFAEARVIVDSFFERRNK